LLPTSRIVPTTITKITASITAYSAMSWPSSCRHSLRKFMFAPLVLRPDSAPIILQTSASNSCRLVPKISSGLIHNETLSCEDVSSDAFIRARKRVCRSAHPLPPRNLPNSPARRQNGGRHAPPEPQSSERWFLYNNSLVVQQRARHCSYFVIKGARVKFQCEDFL
jgi:hypothetical protein